MGVKPSSEGEARGAETERSLLAVRWQEHRTGVQCAVILTVYGLQSSVSGET